MKSFTKLLIHIQQLGLSNSQDFPIKITNELVESLCLVACSFYTISHDESSLILRGQKGFKYEDYISFELPLNTIAGNAYRSEQVKNENGLYSSPEYRDKNLVKKYQLEEIIVIPLYMLRNEDNSDCIGVACLYPQKSINKGRIDNIQELQQSISLAYTCSVERTKMQVRERVVSAISKSMDLNSALHRILQSLKSQTNIEAGSVYLYDEKTRLLRLHATTGISTEENLAKHDIVFNRRDSKYITWTSFKDTLIISLSHAKEIGASAKYIETTRSPISSLLLIPILKIRKSGSERNTIGILRVINKLLLHNGKYELISFTKEDVEIFSYICEIIGLSSHMFLSKENRVSYFEKIMHGTKSNIQTSIQNLDFLEMRGNLDAFLSKELQFTIYDTKEWLHDIKNQMDRLDAPYSSELDMETISLTGDILFNSKRLFEKSAENNDIPHPKFTNLEKEGFFNLPRVKGNPRALMTVFRNLVENALKYRNHDSNTCEIKLSYEVIEDHVCIYFTDFGIGIPDEDKFDVFDEGFRAENAIRQDPAGTGLGLTQSKEIMRSMDGDLSLKATTPVTVIVKIKKA